MNFGTLIDSGVDAMNYRNMYEGETSLMVSAVVNVKYLGHRYTNVPGRVMDENQVLGDEHAYSQTERLQSIGGVVPITIPMETGCRHVCHHHCGRYSDAVCTRIQLMRGGCTNDQDTIHGRGLECEYKQVSMIVALGLLVNCWRLDGRHG